MLTTDGIVRVQSRKGASIEIDTRTLNPGAKLQAALDHLLEGGKLADLAPKDRIALKKKKSLIGSGENALIIRFDVKIVRIDEKLPIDLGKLAK